MRTHQGEPPDHVTGDAFADLWVKSGFLLVKNMDRNERVCVTGVPVRAGMWNTEYSEVRSVSGNSGQTSNLGRS